MNKREHASFKQSWLCEAIHLRESQWGPQDDSKARLLAQHELSPLAKVTCRAQVLSQNIGLTGTIATISSAGWYSVVLILIFALLTGASMALTALGNGTHPVNIVWALISLLGLNVFFLILWCLALLSPTASGGRLALLWPWLTRKLARGPDMGLAVQAWWGVLHQAQATRWLLSTGTHAIWIAASLGAAATMLFALSTRQYDFVWETTVLSSEVFVTWIGYLGVVPQWLGFVVPDSETVRASGSVSQQGVDLTRRLWSGWLVGCLVVYGVLPRVFLVLWSGLLAMKRLSHAGPDLSSPYYLSVLSRMPSFEHQTDGKEPSDSVLTRGLGSRSRESNIWHTQHILIAIEPDPNEAWPPAGIGAALTCASPVDSRESRKHILASVAHARPNCLVLACDARHSPDRGTLRLIADLSEHSKRALLWLRHSQTPHAHTEAWVAQLRNLPQIELKIRDDALSVMQWLERHHD
jgi:hypothetical protein